MEISRWSCDDTVSLSLSSESHVFNSHLSLLTYDKLCLPGHFHSSPWRRQQHHCGVWFLPVHVSNGHHYLHLSASLQIAGFNSRDKNKIKTEKWFIPLSRERKGEGAGERDKKTTTPSACGHRGHISQMGNESKGTFTEVAEQGESLFDYFNSVRLPPSVRSPKDIISFQ